MAYLGHPQYKALTFFSTNSGNGTEYSSVIQGLTILGNCVAQSWICVIMIIDNWMTQSPVFNSQFLL